jgi:hypothetical protein
LKRTLIPETVTLPTAPSPNQYGDFSIPV